MLRRLKNSKKIPWEHRVGAGVFIFPVWLGLGIYSHSRLGNKFLTVSLWFQALNNHLKFENSNIFINLNPHALRA
jgi:hypothetical protein